MSLNNNVIKKKKLLWVGDDYRSKTGYGRVAKELFLHLSQKYEIINYAIACKGISDEYYIVDSNDGTSFGFNKLPQTINILQPDIVILLNDSKIIYNWLKNIDEKKTHDCIIIPYVCTEYIGVPKNEILLYNKLCTSMLAMADFTINEFVKNGFTKNTMRLSHGYSETIVKKNKEESKELMGIDKNCFVFFSGSKNQPRKRLDIIVRAFVDFLIEHNDSNVLLLMNCGLIDMGWNLPDLYFRLCEENGILNPEKFIKFSSNNITDSNKNDDELSIIYNATDVGITTSTGESFGLIPFEQSVLGIPQIIPNWGGIIESIKHGSIKIEPNDYYVYPVVLQAGCGEARTVFYKDVSKAMKDYYTNKDLYNFHCIEIKKNCVDNSWFQISEKLIIFLENVTM